MYRYEFQIYRGNDSRWYWRLVRFVGPNQNGDIIATGHQGHPTIQACQNEISHVKAASTAPVYTV